MLNRMKLYAYFSIHGDESIYYSLSDHVKQNEMECILHIICREYRRIYTGKTAIQICRIYYYLFELALFHNYRKNFLVKGIQGSSFLDVLETKRSHIYLQISSTNVNEGFFANIVVSHIVQEVLFHHQCIMQL